MNQKFHRFILSCLICGFLAASGVAQDSDADEGKVRELIGEGQQSLQAEEWSDAAESFAKAVKLDPKNALAWQLHGFALHSDGKLDAAIKSHHNAAKFADDDNPIKGIALYNLGCAYSLKKEKKKAMDYLDKAIDAGMVNMQYYENDTDLDNLRKEERFKKIVEVAKAGGRQEEEKADKKKVSIVGKWKVVEGTRSGEEIDSSRLPPSIKITKKQIKIPSPDGGDGFVMNYKLDTSKEPIEINMDIDSGPAEGKAIGIIKMKKGKLVLCYDPQGESRPKKFETTEDNGCFMFVLEKAKEKNDGAEAKDGNSVR